MNKPKIIFFDVDGTLVPLKGAARPRTLEALRRLHQNGIRLHRHRAGSYGGAEV